VVDHLKTQGAPDYLDGHRAKSDEKPARTVRAGSGVRQERDGRDEGGDLYDKAVKVVMRDRKCSTSYIQRRLQIGYNRAASLVERMEQEGLVGPANHAGKREILVEGGDAETY
jgi:S-DNA-T family DNA segregation ATPase FtsK/SpoIIIE